MNASDNKDNTIPHTAGADKTQGGGDPGRALPDNGISSPEDRNTDDYWKNRASDFDCIMKFMSCTDTDECERFARICDRKIIWELLENERKFFTSPDKVRDYVACEIRDRKISEKLETEALAEAARAAEEAHAAALRADRIESEIIQEIAAFEDLLGEAECLFEIRGNEFMPALASYETGWDRLAEKKAELASSRVTHARERASIETRRAKKSEEDLAKVRWEIQDLKKLMQSCLKE